MVNDMIMSVPIKALLLLLPATNLMYYFKDYEMKKISVLLTMLLLSIIFAHAQQISIKGIVIDKKLNEPIIGASDADFPKVVSLLYPISDILHKTLRLTEIRPLSKLK